MREKTASGTCEFGDRNRSQFSFTVSEQSVEKTVYGALAAVAAIAVEVFYHFPAAGKANASLEGGNYIEQGNFGRVVGENKPGLLAAYPALQNSRSGKLAQGRHERTHIHIIMSGDGLGVEVSTATEGLGKQPTSNNPTSCRYQKHNYLSSTLFTALPSFMKYTVILYLTKKEKEMNFSQYTAPGGV